MTGEKFGFPLFLILLGLPIFKAKFSSDFKSLNFIAQGKLYIYIYIYIYVLNIMYNRAI